jgi:hypothetical protein
MRSDYALYRPVIGKKLVGWYEHARLEIPTVSYLEVLLDYNCKVTPAEVKPPCAVSIYECINLGSQIYSLALVYTSRRLERSRALGVEFIWPRKS